MGKTRPGTTLRLFGPESDSIEDLESWRNHIRDHIGWIDEHRSQLKIYRGIRKLYLREFLKTSVRLQKARAAAKKQKGIAA